MKPQTRILTPLEVNFLKGLGLGELVEEQKVFVLKQGNRSLPKKAKKSRNKGPKPAAKVPRNQYKIALDAGPSMFQEKTMLYTAAGIIVRNPAFFEVFHTTGALEQYLADRSGWPLKRASNTIYRLYREGFFIKPATK